MIAGSDRRQKRWDIGIGQKFILDSEQGDLKVGKRERGEPGTESDAKKVQFSDDQSVHEQGHDEHGSKRAQIRSDGNGHEQGYGHGHDGHDDSTLLDAAAVAHAFMRDPRRLKAAAGASLASQNIEAAIHGYPQTEVIVPASEENPVHGRAQVIPKKPPTESTGRAERIATVWYLQLQVHPTGGFISRLATKKKHLRPGKTPCDRVSEHPRSDLFPS